jgi:hypothetical protein
LPYNPARRTGRFGLLPFRSPLLGKSSLFLRVLRCFSSPGSPPDPMCSDPAAQAFPHAGFPIRTSLAQAGAHPLPELFAVYHVLLRQLTPRHPPYALSSLSLHVIRRNGCSRVTFAYALVKVPGNCCRPVLLKSPSASPLDRHSLLPSRQRPDIDRAAFLLLTALDVCRLTYSVRRCYPL